MPPQPSELIGFSRSKVSTLVARKAGSHGPTTSDAIRRVGLALIYKHGYETMNLRDLAREVGIQAGSLYNHISSKQSLLFDLMRTHQESVLDGCRAALGDLTDPILQLRAFARFHVSYHITRKQDVYVGNFELRSLEPDNYRFITEERRSYELILIQIIEKGQKTGAFDAGDVKVAAYGILAMLTGVCTWYSPEGGMDADSITEIYVEMCLKSIKKELKS